MSKREEKRALRDARRRQAWDVYLAVSQEANKAWIAYKEQCDRLQNWAAPELVPYAREYDGLIAAMHRLHKQYVKIR